MKKEIEKIPMTKPKYLKNQDESNYLNMILLLNVGLNLMFK